MNTEKLSFLNQLETEIIILDRELFIIWLNDSALNKGWVLNSKKDKNLITDQFSEETTERVMDFVDINKKNLRELSLRTVLKIADLAKAFPSNWEAMAENTVLRRA